MDGLPAGAPASALLPCVGSEPGVWALSGARALRCTRTQSIQKNIEKHAENAHVQHASTANQKMTKSEAARFVAAGERAAGLAAVQNAEDALLERPIVASHN